MYANQINLGQRGSFSIDGFGEASQTYFGKDIRQLDLPECAFSPASFRARAGSIPSLAGPSHRSPQPRARLHG
jgi:membrane carboxypeptidase/penicillin-binding protein